MVKKKTRKETFVRIFPKIIYNPARNTGGRKDERMRGRKKNKEQGTRVKRRTRVQGPLKVVH